MYWETGCRVYIDKSQHSAEELSEKNVANRVNSFGVEIVAPTKMELGKENSAQSNCGSKHQNSSRNWR